jgi:hypothetical protein
MPALVPSNRSAGRERVGSICVSSPTPIVALRRHREAERPPCMREHTSYFIVGDTASGEPDVAHHSACCRGARQPVLRGASLRATHSTRRIGRRRHGADQRHTVRSRKSQAGFRSERLRQRLECAAAPSQYPHDHNPTGTSGTGTRRRAVLLSIRLTAADQRVRRRAEKQDTPSPARPSAGQLVHGDLPGLLVACVDQAAPPRLRRPQASRRSAGPIDLDQVATTGE